MDYSTKKIGKFLLFLISIFKPKLLYLPSFFLPLNPLVPCFSKKWTIFSYPPKKTSSTLPSCLVTNFMRMVFPESRISLQPFSADRVSQRWTVVGSKLQNGPDNPNWVIGLADDTAQSGAFPKAMTYQGNTNQHWAVEYV